MNVKCLFGFHKYELIDEVCNGVALSWGANPVPSYTYIYKCDKCLKIKYRKDYYLPLAAEKARGRKYDNTGWPLDEYGNKI